MHTRTQQEHYIWIRSLFLHLFLNQFSVSMTSDESFLLFSGGLQHNCLNHILNTKNNNDDNELPIIRRSSYFFVESSISTVRLIPPSVWQS